MTAATDSIQHLPDATVRSWEALAATAARMPTQDVAWMLASLAAFKGSENVLTLETGEDLEAVAPLVRNSGRLELPGCASTKEPVDFLAATPGAAEAIADRAAATGLPLLLERTPARSGTIEYLRSAFGGRAVVRLEQRVGFPVLRLDERWAEPGGGLSSSRRSALRRGRRKAERYGTVEVELLTPGADELDSLILEAFDVEARSWKAQAGTAVAYVPRMNAFYRAYAHELARRGQLRLDFLRVNGRAVASQFGAVWKGRHWLFKIGYDARFAKASPGQLLLAESIAGATRAGLSHYEMLGHPDHWTDAWTKRVEPCACALFIPPTNRGALGAAALSVRGVRRRLGIPAKRLRKQVHERVRRAYITGTDLDDALAELARHSPERAGIVGYWPGGSDRPEEIAAQVEACAERLPAKAEVAFKLSDMMMGDDALDSLAARAVERDLTLHIDAIGIDSASANQRTARRLSEAAPRRIGCTLPGRWRRSVADARALADSGLRLRIVKGEFEGPPGEEVDPCEGFREVVATLVSSNCHIEVATHDTDLAADSLGRLVAAGVSCELQVLFATDGSDAERVARELGVPVRVYLPYGHGRAPYNLADLRRTPTLMSTLARDLLPRPSRGPSVA